MPAGMSQPARPLPLLACALLLAAAVSCLSQPLQELSSPPGGLTLTTPALPAGVYQITFRLQVDQPGNSITPLADLQISVPGYANLAGRTLTPLHFSAADTATEFTFPFDNFAAQPITAQVVMAPASGPGLTVNQITVAPVRRLCVGTVWPGKRLYRRNEAAQGLVTVFNGTDAPGQATLRCALESDVDKERTVKEETVALAAGERREVAVTWNTGQEEYGFALAASLLDAAGQTLSEGREYFSVADNLWKVCLTQSGRGCAVPWGHSANEGIPVDKVKEWEQKLAAELAKPFAPVYWNYANYVEFYAWSPDDFFDMTPEADYWYSGTGNYTVGKRDLQMSVEWLHQRGMRASSYLNPSSIGYGGLEAYTQHPEWFIYDENGQLVMGSYYQKKMEVGSKIRPPGEGPWELQLVWYALGLNVNIATFDPVDAQVDQMLKAQKMFGWDAFRFDNATYGAHGYDFWGKRIDGNDPKKKDALEARAWAHMCDRIWEALGPDFPLGDNNDYEFRETRGAAAWDESCRKGQLLMEEMPRSSYVPSSRTNRWHDFMTWYHQSGEVVRKLGGHHLLIGFDRQNPVDHLYMTVLTYAGRSHPYNRYHADTLPLGNYAQFITRYSALMWDIDRVQALPDPGKRLTIKSASPVWWQDYATVRTTPDGARQYIVHLVNPPVQERVYTDPTNQVPPPQKDLTVTLNLENDEKITRATLLTADPVMSRTDLPVTAQGNQVSVTVPLLYFWDVLVLE